MARREQQLPPADAPVTKGEVLRLIERLGHDPNRVGRVTFSATTAGIRVTVTYARGLDPDG